MSKFNYVDLISSIGEVNRCPGGVRTIRKILMYSMLRSGARVLEIGSNTGFTSIEVARMRPDLEIYGIDVNEKAITASKANLAKEIDEVQKCVHFSLGNALDLPFPDKYFDLVITGGATSFINPEYRSKAVSEYCRVLNDCGLIAITNLYYAKEPPSALLESLSDVLGVKMEAWGLDYWMRLFLAEPMEIAFFERHGFKSINNERIETYLASFDYNNEDDKKNYEYCIRLFSENHAYLEYFILGLGKKGMMSQQELFFEDSAYDRWLHGEN